MSRHSQLSLAAPRATLTGKNISPDGVFRTGQTPSICLPGPDWHLCCLLAPSSPAPRHWPPPGPLAIKTPPPAWANTPRWSISSEGYGLFPTTDGYLAGRAPVGVICYCKCLSDTFGLFVVMADGWETSGLLWKTVINGASRRREWDCLDGMLKVWQIEGTDVMGCHGTHTPYVTSLSVRRLNCLSLLLVLSGDYKCV